MYDFIQTVEDRFFKKKTMDLELNQDTLPEDTNTDVAQTPEAVETPVEPVQPSGPSLDCPNCKGLGLVDEKRCPNCEGTGKAQDNPQAFPDGTQVIRPDGTFNVVNGVEVKQE